MAFRFVHAADVHLDSPLRSLVLRDPELAELIGNATRRAFVAIIDLCLDEQVDALLLAGDLYDGEQTSMKTARFLAEQLRRLDEAGIRVFVIRGNHDALSRITKELTLPPSVTLFSGRGEVVPWEHGSGLPLAIHGLSFARPEAPESLLPRYRQPVEGAVNIGLMHTSLDGSPGHDPYAPCKVSDLRNSGFRYWALGHIHRRAVIEGDCTIVMPGMPQGRDINEAGMKSVCLVTVSDDRTIAVEERRTGLAQFERVSVDMTGIDGWGAAVAAIGAALHKARPGVASDHMIVRLRLTGVTPLAWRLRRDLDLLKAEADNRAAGAGTCWIERVELACDAPPAVVASVTSADPLLELRQLIQTEIIGAAGFQTEMAAIVEELSAQMPEFRRMFGADAADSAARIAEIVRGGVEDVLARLHAPDRAEEA